MSGNNEIPLGPIAVEPICPMPPMTAPPIPPPIHAVKKGLPSGNVTPYIKGYPIPKNPTGSAPFNVLRNV